MESQVEVEGMKSMNAKNERVKWNIKCLVM